MKKLILQNSQNDFLQDIWIDDIKFNGYPGKIEVPEYAEVKHTLTGENDCTVITFTLALKKPHTFKSGYLKVKIPYTYPPNGLKVWTARENYPQDLYYLGGTHLIYGDVCYGTMIPAITLYDVKR
ncbi:MAG: hypothetical protein IKC05_09420, partial [Lentisphaeria bacterium]|nr:hypothetical protein [Lentisphaeria bacterium]